jgi:hypothetical protein
MSPEAQVLERQSNIVAQQFLGEVPLRTGATASIEDVKTIVDGLDHGITVLMYTAVILFPTSPRREAVIAILETRLAQHATTPKCAQIVWRGDAQGTCSATKADHGRIHGHSFLDSKTAS